MSSQTSKVGSNDIACRNDFPMSVVYVSPVKYSVDIYDRNNTKTAPKYRYLVIQGYNQMDSFQEVIVDDNKMLSFINPL